jgi:hypothetical protein
VISTAAPPVTPTAGETAAEPSAQELTLERVKRAWELILQRVQAVRVPLYGYLRDGRPTALEENVLTVSLPHAFAARGAGQGDNATVLAAAVESVLGHRIEVRFAAADGVPSSRTTQATTPAAPPQARADLPDFTDQIRAAQAKLDAELLPDET